MSRSHKKSASSVTISDGGPVRHLHLSSSWIQGSMYRKNPLKLVHEYVEQMMAWALFIEPEQAIALHAVQLGLGAASLTKFCAQKIGMRTTAIEINPAVYQVCLSSFGLQAENERLKVIIEDAKTYVARTSLNKTIDVLQIDLYDRDAASPLLCSPDFYEHCQAILTDQGCMTINIFGTNSNFERTKSNITSAFGLGHVFSFPSTIDGNTVLIAIKTLSKIDNAILFQRASWIEDQWGLPAKTWVRALDWA
jgi:spermidine synthase